MKLISVTHYQVHVDTDDWSR